MNLTIEELNDLLIFGNHLQFYRADPDNNLPERVIDPKNPNHFIMKDEAWFWICKVQYLGYYKKSYSRSFIAAINALKDS